MPYYRRNLFILSITIFLSAASWNQVVPFLPLFLRDLGVKTGALQWSGWVFAAPAIASIVAMPFWGKMGDRHGQKKMVIRAGICLSAIYFGMSICTAPWHLVMLRFLNGALTGFIPGSMALIATNTPQEYAARSVATAQTASAAGQILGPAVGGFLAAIFTYRGSMRISGAAVLLSVLLVLFLVKEPNKERIAEPTTLLQDFAASLRSPILAPIMLILLLYGLFVGSISPILTVHLTRMNAGMPISFAGRMLSLTEFAGLVFALLPAAFLLSTYYLWTRLGERRGFHRNVQIGLVGTTVSAFALAVTKNIWVFSALFFTAGLWLAAINSATSAIICTEIDEGSRGHAYGMQLSANMLGALIAPLVAGYVGSALGIPSVFILISVIFLAGSFVFPMTRRRVAPG
jgi:MFS transporter, DHA1 family, multidrug resistance protein